MLPKKAFIFCTSCIDNSAANHHFNRYDRWIKFYQPILDTFDADRLLLIDDAGSGYEEYLPYSENTLPEQPPQSTHVYRFREKLGRSSQLQFPGWWRSYLFSIDYARKYGYNKIIHIESDFFIFSDRLKNFIANLNSGWTSLYSTFYDLPETAVQVICEDQFSNFDHLSERVKKENYLIESYAEVIIPFTHVEHQFNGDRFGEELVLARWIDMHSNRMHELDYFGQIVLPPNLKVAGSPAESLNSKR